MYNVLSFHFDLLLDFYPSMFQENLTSSVLGAVKGDIQKHLTGMNDTLFEVGEH